MDPYMEMQGPNEFLYVGNLKDWNRIPDMGRITVPALVMCGQHDEMTPVCAMRMQRALPDAEITVFPNSAHMPMYEEADAYLARVAAFLHKHSRRKRTAAARKR
jgi:proline iminopeptidase